MVVQTANNHAVKKYEQFVSAINTLQLVLDESEAVVKPMRDKSKRSSGGWAIPAKSEVVAARKNALKALTTLQTEAKKYEAELVSRGWRV